MASNAIPFFSLSLINKCRYCAWEIDTVYIQCTQSVYIGEEKRCISQKKRRGRETRRFRDLYTYSHTYTCCTSSNHRERKGKSFKTIPTRREFPREEKTGVCVSRACIYTFSHAHSTATCVGIGAFSLKCTSPGNALQYRPHVSLSPSFSFIPPRNPGYTLTATASRSTLHVQGGANLQRVGVSRGMQPSAMSLPSHRGASRGEQNIEVKCLRKAKSGRKRDEFDRSVMPTAMSSRLSSRPHLISDKDALLRLD